MNRFIYSLVLLGTTTLTSLAQEICNNGIDDDNDSFVDCFDTDCTSNQACEGTYIGNDATCEALPAQFPAFKMTLDWGSPNKVTNHLNRMSVGDLDRDGIPEIVVTNIEGNSRGAYVLYGNSGQIKHSKKNFNFSIDREVAIANLDDDNCAEIFITGRQSGTWYLWSYSCDLATENWRSPALSGDPGLFALANFNGDDKVELYFRDMILNAHTGALIANSPTTYGANNGSPVAVDIVGDQNLELVNGLRIYSVDIAAGTITEHSRRTEYFLRANPDGSHTSVADFNQDGNLDVLATGSTIGNDQNTTIFFWDVAANTLKTYSDPRPGNFSIQNCQGGTGFSTGEFYKNGWHRGTGRLNIADANGDGVLDIAFVSGKFLYALTNTAPGVDTLQSIWIKTVSEETSGYTGCSMFDFNGDGKTEIVYRDERNLYIVNGTDGSTYTSQPCISRTSRDYPIVADVDADGQSELCVTCGFDNQAAAANFCDISFSEESHVRVYRTDLEPWVPSRRVWNQNAYFNVNVNDDLTIPRQQQSQTSVFSTTGCSLGGPLIVRPLNTFLNQSPYLSSQGCPKYASPDLSYLDNSLSVNLPTCPEANFTISFTIENLGDVPVSGDVPITFYKGDPLQPGAVKLNTIATTITSLLPGRQHVINNVTVNGDGSNFTLYIAINDTGNTVPSPITFPNSTILECDYDNVVSVDISPLPAQLSAELIKDNIKCLGSTTPDNGAVRAFVVEGISEDSTSYDFFWSNGTSVATQPDFTGPIYTGLVENTYTIYAVHKTAQCSSDTVQVVVGRVDVTIDVDIELISDNTNCITPNGELEATVPGRPLTDFTFAWYEGNDIFTSPQIGVSSQLTGLPGGITYTVLVTDIASGCPATASQAITNIAPTPDPDITVTNITCSITSTGTASASVGASTSGYTFNWYNGNAVLPTPDFTGATYANLTAGTYTLLVTDDTSDCNSVAETITVTQTTSPTVSAIVTAMQTSCDSSLPNGAVAADVAGTTTGFTFTWFEGQSTLPANQVATVPSVSNLPAGVYTVVATDVVTGCTDTEEVTVLSNVVTPSLAVSGTGNLTDCTTANGSVTVSIVPNVPSDYTFSWYIGSSVGSTPDFPETGPTLSNLPVGTYTVLATHNSNHCVTQPVTASVLDATPTIDIQQRSSVQSLPTDCNTSNGTLGVEITAAGNTGGFFAEWFKNNALTAFHTETTLQFSTATGLGAGNYTVRVTNLDNGCVASKTFVLPFADLHRLKLMSKSDATTCSPQTEGTFTVQLVPTPLVFTPAITVADYELFFYEGKDDTGPLIAQVTGSAGTPVNDSADYVFSGLAPGFYTVIATENNPLLSGCESPPVVVEILPFDNSPTITASTQDNNTNCAGTALPTGHLVAVADNLAPSGYTFEWFAGSTTADPPVTTLAGVNDCEAVNLTGGQYTVRVTNNVTLCSAVATFPVFDTPPVVAIADADLVISPVSLCSVMNGSAELTGIREDGNVVPLTGYTVEWFTSNLVSLGSANPRTGLSPGTYFVRATNASTNCANSLKSFDILDSTPGTVGIDLISFTDITRCLKPANMVGELQINVTGSSATGFSIQWYNGSTTAAPLLVGENGATLTGRTMPGDYTVEVTNNENNCTAEATYTLQLEIAPISMTASAASPMTSCAAPNGQLFATVTNAFSTQYTYTWRGSNNAVVGTGKQLFNMGVDTYTVVAVDQADNTCTAGPLTVEIEEGRVFPVPAAAEVEPVTACTVALADGVASASVAGNVVDYQFDWYVGSVVSGSPFYTGVQVSGLSDVTYTVRATHIQTGCSGDATVTISRIPLTTPDPSIEIISHVTECDPSVEVGVNLPVDNGALSASVEGNTSNYIFNWTTGFVGEQYDNLSAGTYTVTTTDRVTGCVSNPVTARIEEQLAIPDFDFTTLPATCEQENGYASVEIRNNITVSEIRWTIDGGFVYAPIIDNIAEGIYPVLVRSSAGCYAIKDVTVGTEIRPFNGVSRGAGNTNQNDKFKIACIAYFPTNFVKIYNRSGTLVYEAEGYDNIDIFFDGRSNRGISPLGNNLPDGTYFYVIDKNDGSKPIAGYLEIVN